MLTAAQGHSQLRAQGRGYSDEIFSLDVERKVTMQKHADEKCGAVRE